MVYLPALFGREQEQKRHNTRQNTNCRLSGRVVLAAVARERMVFITVHCFRVSGRRRRKKK